MTTKQTDRARTEIDRLITLLLRRFHDGTLVPTREEHAQLRHAHACLADAMRDLRERTGP